MTDIVDRLRQYRGRSFETTECYNGLRDEAAAEIDRLHEWKARAHQMDNEKTARLIDAESRASTLAAENERMREALRFYSDPSKYTDIHGDDVTVPDFYSELDFGETARTTLAALTAPAPGGERNVCEDEHRMLDKALRASTELAYEIEPAPASPRNGGE